MSQSVALFNTNLYHTGAQGLNKTCISPGEVYGKKQNFYQNHKLNSSKNLRWAPYWWKHPSIHYIPLVQSQVRVAVG